MSHLSSRMVAFIMWSVLILIGGGGAFKKKLKFAIEKRILLHLSPKFFRQVYDYFSGVRRRCHYNNSTSFSTCHRYTVTQVHGYNYSYFHRYIGQVKSSSYTATQGIFACLFNFQSLSNTINFSQQYNYSTFFST